MALGLLVTVILIWIVAEIFYGVFNEALKKQEQEATEQAAETAFNYYKEKYEDKAEEIRNLQKFLKSIRLYVRLGIAVIITLITVFSSFYTLDEQHMAVVTTFGRPEAVTDTGFHFKVPYIQKVKKIDSTIQGFAIGYTEEKNETDDADSLMITSDFNFVNVDFYIEYKVTDAIQYLYGSSNPEGVLRNIAQACIRNTIGMYAVDDVLTTGKSEIQANIKEDIIRELSESHTGLYLVNITIQDAEPPTEEVLSAFQQVEQAKQSAETSVNKAEEYKNEQLPTARANADEIKRQAEATKQERIDEAVGEVAVFNAMYEEYIKDPDITKMRMYYESMEKLMPNLKVIVNGTDSEIKPIIVQENQ